jgi:hypothetical protein
MKYSKKTKELKLMSGVDDLLERIREDVNLMSFDELLDSEYPNFHGTGLYISVACTNHSWKPNVSMDFNEGSAVVSCTAIRDILADEWFSSGRAECLRRV